MDKPTKTLTSSSSSDENHNLDQNGTLFQRSDEIEGGVGSSDLFRSSQELFDPGSNCIPTRSTGNPLEGRQSSVEDASEDCPLLGSRSTNGCNAPFQNRGVIEPFENSSETKINGANENSKSGGVFQNGLYDMAGENPTLTAKMIPFDTARGGPFNRSPFSAENDACASGFGPLLRQCMRPSIANTGKGRGKKKKESGIINVLAAQTLKIASINGLGELDKLESDLEEEILYDNRSPAKTSFGRICQEGSIRLHSKFVLFVVVALNIIDCLLVMAELTLDFHHVSHLLQNKQDMIDDFSNHLADVYSPMLADLVGEENYHLFQEILNSFIVWGPNVNTNHGTSPSDMAAQCMDYVTSASELNNQSFPSYVASLPSHSNWSSANTTTSSFSSCFRSMGSDPFNPNNHSSTSTQYAMTHFDKVDKTLIVVAHKLHYISLSILSVLVIILILKIVCSGKRFFKSRMQVFDGIVIIISFIIDLVFIEGLTIFQVQDFVIILTFLLPWRILRVLNSLIVAVLDKQRLNLKIIYTQKKKISRNLSEATNKVEVLQRQIQVLQGLCSSRGIQERDVRKVLGTEKPDKKGGNQGGGGLASMMALGKLAFQAADALAPMPNDFCGSGGSSTPSTPVLLSPFMLGNSSTTTVTPPETPDNNLNSRRKKKTTTIAANGTGKSFNGNTITTPNGIGNSPKLVLEGNPEETHPRSILKRDENELSVGKSHSLDGDSIGTESEDLGDRDEDAPGTVSTSQITLNSSPGALGPSAATSKAADSIAIEIEDLDPDPTTSNASSPNSLSRSASNPRITSDDEYINLDDANSQL